MNERTYGPLRDPERRAAALRATRRGVRHRGRVEPRSPQAGDRPTLSVDVGLPYRIERVECVLLEPEEARIPLRWVKTEWDLLNWVYVQVWQGELPARAAGTLVRYRINAYPSGEAEAVQADGGSVYAYLVESGLPPDWARTAIIYQILPDRFHPGPGRPWRGTKTLDDVHGGTLKGILHNLDYIADLGFNCLWLTPIFPDHTHHGYHATDYFTVNPRLGSMDDVRALVDECHQRGMRLVLDFAANHCGSGHPAFQEALENRESRFHNWFLWERWPDRYETYFNVRDLPKLNVAHPEVRRYLLDSALFWLDEVGFDGLRLDHANGIPLDFWTELRRVLKAQKPDCWIFGEAIEPPDRQLDYVGRLDGCLDFLLNQKLRDTFVFGSMTLSAFESFVSEHERFFPPNFHRPSFLDNHDMDRFLFIAGGDRRRLKLAALCQFTLPGQPIVYYGTEAGVGQEVGIHQIGSNGMVEARQLMRWGKEQERELVEYYRWLIHFRREHPALAIGRLRTLHVDDRAGTMAYVRMGEGEEITVALNLSEAPRIVQAGEHSFSLSPYSGDVQVARQTG